MKRYRLLVALGVMLAPLFAARGQDKVGKTPYFPAAVGTAWEYRAGDNRFTHKVARHEKVGGVTCARVEQLINNKVVAYEDVGVTAEGVSRYAFDGKEAKPPITFLKLPAKKGQTWKVESKIGDQTVKGSFKSGEAGTVKVPAGTYKNAVTVTSEDLEVNGIKTKVVYYFAEDVGLVKLEWGAGKSKVVIELEKYTAGK
jgi:hypothetical protein